MSTRRFFQIITVISTVIAANSPSGLSVAASQALNVWVESISNKVQPTTTPILTTSLNLEGAQRSVEAAQIIVGA